MNSPKANLFNAVLNRLQELKKLRYIDQDLGQLENYEFKPAVSWPCGLIDIEEFKYTDQGNDNEQFAIGIVSLRAGMVQYSQSNNLTPENIRANALEYMELEDAIYDHLHGWAAPGFSKLLCRADGTERREDDIRVKVMKFEVSFTRSNKKAKITVPRPGISLGTNIPNS